MSKSDSNTESVSGSRAYKDPISGLYIGWTGWYTRKEPSGPAGAPRRWFWCEVVAFVRPGDPVIRTKKGYYHERPADHYFFIWTLAGAPDDDRYEETGQLHLNASWARAFFMDNAIEKESRSGGDVGSRAYKAGDWVWVSFTHAEPQPGRITAQTGTKVCRVLFPYTHWARQGVHQIDVDRMTPATKAEVDAWRQAQQSLQAGDNTIRDLRAAIDLHEDDRTVGQEPDFLKGGGTVHVPLNTVQALSMYVAAEDYLQRHAKRWLKRLQAAENDGLACRQTVLSELLAAEEIVSRLRPLMLTPRQVKARQDIRDILQRCIDELKGEGHG